MAVTVDFISRLEAKVSEQLRAQRVGFLLGAGSSYLDGRGYPIAAGLWDGIKDHISDRDVRMEIQEKLDSGAGGIEEALDLLDNGQANETLHRRLVTEAIAEFFAPMIPPLETHVEFVRRLARRPDPSIKIFTLNYDPLIERAAEKIRVRLYDGFCGYEHAFFDSSVFEERIGRLQWSFKGKRFQPTARPLLLLKLHGSLGWYNCDSQDIRRCAFSSLIANPNERLMIPPQQRKANETMKQPYAALWSSFRGCLGQSTELINRLVCIGYGFLDEHVNTLVENALARSDFTLLIFAKQLSNRAWSKWSTKPNVVAVTEARCSLKGEMGPGHPDLWSFERLSKEV